MQSGPSETNAALEFAVNSLQVSFFFAPFLAYNVQGSS